MCPSLVYCFCQPAWFWNRPNALRFHFGILVLLRCVDPSRGGKDFYQNDELVAMTRERTDALRRSRTINWQKKETARAGMRMMVKRWQKKFKYPPEGMDDTLATVIGQCEMYNYAPIRLRSRWSIGESAYWDRAKALTFSSARKTAKSAVRRYLERMRG